MSQFYPGSANPTLNRMMGFLEEDEPDGVLVERFRLVAFLVDEPDRAVNYAAWAWWLHDDGNPKLAMEVLEQGIEKLEHPERNAFFVSVNVAVLFDLGRFDEMSTWMDLWPEPHTGYTYWRWQAAYLDEVQGKFEEALPLYQKAIVTWPGPAEWRVQNQMANCLSQMGQKQRAAEVRARAKQIEDLMEVEVHTHLRQILGDLNNAAKLEELVKFYRDIDRPREAQAWQEHVDALAK
jgi:tetratricopeptide (TPR) repeat protein